MVANNCAFLAYCYGNSDFEISGIEEIRSNFQSFVIIYFGNRFGITSALPGFTMTFVMALEEYILQTG
jgi:hypothetical protein